MPIGDYECSDSDVNVGDIINLVDYAAGIYSQLSESGKLYIARVGAHVQLCEQCLLRYRDELYYGLELAQLGLFGYGENQILQQLDIVEQIKKDSNFGGYIC